MSLNQLSPENRGDLSGIQYYPVISTCGHCSAEVTQSLFKQAIYPQTASGKQKQALVVNFNVCANIKQGGKQHACSEWVNKGYENHSRIFR